MTVSDKRQSVAQRGGGGGTGSGLSKSATEIQWCGVVFAGNAVDVMLTHDHADNSSSFLDHIQSMATFIVPARRMPWAMNLPPKCDCPQQTTTLQFFSLACRCTWQALWISECLHSPWFFRAVSTATRYAPPAYAKPRPPTMTALVIGRRRVRLAWQPSQCPSLPGAQLAPCWRRHALCRICCRIPAELDKCPTATDRTLSSNQTTLSTDKYTHTHTHTYTHK